jgi:hypothetical protein
MIKQIYKFLSPRFQNLFLEYKVNLHPRYGHGKPPHPELYSIINTNRGLYKDLLLKAINYKDAIGTIKDSKVESNPQQPVWNNSYLPGLDIIGLYTMLCEFKPNKYLEVGSGNSTKVAFKAKCDKNLCTEIICIDPNPRIEVDSIANKVFKQQFESVNFDLVTELNSGDILFIDNSHRILPNSDSMVFYLEILPRLKKGVIVHIHDIYLPYDYPQFMCDRFYSEQYGIAMYLLANAEKYEPILPNYFISCDMELSKILSPFWQLPNLADVERHGGSFWLRIN